MLSFIEKNNVQKKKNTRIKMEHDASLSDLDLVGESWRDLM